MLPSVVAVAVFCPLAHVADDKYNSISSLFPHGSLDCRETREGQPPHVQRKAVCTLQITVSHLLMALIRHHNTVSVQRVNKLPLYTCMLSYRAHGGPTVASPFQTRVGLIYPYPRDIEGGSIIFVYCAVHSQDSLLPNLVFAMAVAKQLPALFLSL